MSGFSHVFGPTLKNKLIANVEQVQDFVKSFFKLDLHETPQKRQKRDRGDDLILVEIIVIANVHNGLKPFFRVQTGLERRLKRSRGTRGNGLMEM